MEVILLESFSKLGKIGDVVNVKDGFARNYLIPSKKALRANKENKDHFTKIKQELLEKNSQVIEEAKKKLEKISKEEIIFIRNASDNGQLYGSVSPKDIANYFNEKKIEIKPSNINLHSAIKKIGIYSINIKLHAEVASELQINVATSVENANLQKNEISKSAEKQEIQKDTKKEATSENKETDSLQKNKINKSAEKEEIQKAKSKEVSEENKENDNKKTTKSKKIDVKSEESIKKEKDNTVESKEAKDKKK